MRPPEHPGVTAPVNSKPEWLRINDAVRIFGLSRSALYDLIGENAIKSTSLARPGTTRGIRLISYSSLSAYIEAAFARQ